MTGRQCFAAKTDLHVRHNPPHYEATSIHRSWASVHCYYEIGPYSIQKNIYRHRWHGITATQQPRYWWNQWSRCCCCAAFCEWRITDNKEKIRSTATTTTYIYMSICIAHTVMCDTSNALVRSPVTWDHTVLPATRQRWFSFIDPGRMKGWVDIGGR